jgi:hypothetical protein
MTKVTVEVDNTENAELLVKLLKSIDFVERIETSDDDFSAEQKAELDKRLLLAEDPSQFRDWDEINAELLKKYGV